MSISKQQILQLLQAAPGGADFGRSRSRARRKFHHVGGRLSKLAAYGELEKLKHLSPAGKTRWRLNHKGNGLSVD